MFLANPPAKKNLVIVAQDYWSDPNDLREIGQVIARRAGDIGVFVVLPRDPPEAMPKIPWDRPTLTVGLGHLGNFNPRRGPIIHNRKMSKLEEYARFRDAGIDTPMTERFEFGKTYDPAIWSDLVILKPLPQALTSKGGNCLLVRTRRLQELSPAGMTPDHFLNRGPALVQQFIDTGKHATYHRVLTLLGEVVYAMTNRSPIERPDLDADDQTLANGVVEPKHPSLLSFAMSDRLTVTRDTAILDFARKVYAACPGIPLQACDILRDRRDGKLYIIEINAAGNTWAFSSQIAKKVREAMGGKAAYLAQFGAWDVAAKVLIEKTRTLAT